jgi:hypothetical protein
VVREGVGGTGRRGSGGGVVSAGCRGGGGRGEK